MIKLWGQPRSINVQKVLWALDEVDVRFERIDAGGQFGRVREAEYLAINPNGLVPTLQDGAAVVWESNAIVRYLFAKYGSAPTQPSDLAVRARADAWTDWKSSTLWPAVRPLLVQLVRTPEEKRDRALVESSHRAATAALAILDQELGRHAYVADEHFTWGDIAVGSVLQRWYNLPIARTPFPALEAWYRRIAERPGFKKWVDLPLA